MLLCNRRRCQLWDSGDADSPGYGSLDKASALTILLHYEFVRIVFGVENSRFCS
jgi:hypothetical protein